jgi:hypothetical protein
MDLHRAEQAKLYKIGIYSLNFQNLRQFILPFRNRPRLLFAMFSLKQSSTLILAFTYLTLAAGKATVGQNITASCYPI